MDNINDISKIDTWDEYKTYVKAVDPEAKADLEEAEQLVSIVSTVIARRNELGISQRAVTK